MDTQTGPGGQRDKKATGRGHCQSVRCDSQSRGNSRQPNRSTGGKPPREGVECDTNLHVHKTVNNSCSIQSNFLHCFYTNVDSVLNKRSELLTVIESECPDIICTRQTLSKNQGGRINPAELQFQDFFFIIESNECHRGIAMWIRKRLGA